MTSQDIRSKPHQRPPGVSLLFASEAEILAAPAAEREAYLAIVDSIFDNPSAFGLRRETSVDQQRDDYVDRRVQCIGMEWSI